MRALFPLLLVILLRYTKATEASSTLLQLHKLYTQQPPHDRSLYNLLGVHPNATAHTITKSYRKLSRNYHPDKSTGNADKLERVRQAYEILKDDTTRWPYHRYGLLGSTQQAVDLLQKGSTDPTLMELIQLTGRHTRHERVAALAAQLVERLRPWVEGSIDEATLVDSVIADCDRWKKQPLGSQILRCMGRAYRYEGERFLKSHQPMEKHVSKVRGTWRHAKHLLTAAVASGRVVVKEQLQTKKTSSAAPALTYHMDEDEEPPSQQEIQDDERRKAEKAILESLQVEALWKISKIDLDQAVRQACRLILQTEFFFFPSDQGDGWIGSHSDHAINTETARRRAAEGMVLVGNIFVRRSKEGTSWIQ